MGKDTKKSGDDAEKGSKGFSAFGDVLKGILASKVITGIVDGAKAMGKAVLDLGKDIFNQTGNWEQLVGGAEKIFDEIDISQIEKDSKQAYKNLGMSASQYMETINQVGATFSSTLGDKKGYETAKQGMQAISDYATGTGRPLDELMQKFTLITRSTSSYQSIADQFSGILPATSKDFLAQAQAVGLLDEKYTKLTDVPIDEYQQAVAGMLEQGTIAIGLHGNTVAEAEGTITGSLSMMQSAWENLKLAIGTGADMEDSITAFSDSLMAFVENATPLIQTIIQNLGTVAVELISTLIPQLVEMIPPLLTETAPILIQAISDTLSAVLGIIPELMPTITQMVIEIVKMFVSNAPQFLVAGISILTSLIQGITQALPELFALMPTIIADIVEIVREWLPDIIEAGMELIKALVEGMMESLPDIIDSGIELLLALIDTFTEYFPEFVEMGVELLTKLIENLPEIIRKIVARIPEIITAIVNALIHSLPALIQAGVDLFVALVKALPTIVVEIVKAVPVIISGLVNAFKSKLSDMKEIGKNLLEGVWNGLKNAGEWLWGKVKGLFSSLTSKIKSFFGIHSPSTLFRDEIGSNLALGLGEGFEDEMADVTKEMQNAIPTSFDVNAGLSTSSASGSAGFSFDTMVSAFRQALTEVKVELDDHEVGSFVDRTVSELVFA